MNEIFIKKCFLNLEFGKKAKGKFEVIYFLQKFDNVFRNLLRYKGWRSKMENIDFEFIFILIIRLFGAISLNKWGVLPLVYWHQD